MQTKLTNLQDSLSAFSHCSSGAVSLEGVEVLGGLGLSGRQARVYLALLRTGDAKVRSVAALTTIDRQEVYRVLDGLQQLGLVQQNVTVPASYSAVPIEDAVRLLLEDRHGELQFVSQRAERLIKKLNQTQRFPLAAVALKPCFGVVVERDGGKRYLKATQDCQHSIEVVASWPRFRKLCFLLETPLKAALKRGVALRVVAEKPPNHNLPKWVIESVSKYPNFQLKILLNAPAAAIVTFDEAQTAFAFNISTGLIRGPTLWTANPHLVAVCRSYFNEVWAQTN